MKLIDAGERLSLQVHPDSEACAVIGGGAQPKTEMWYILGCREDGCILAGLASRATKLKLKESINSPEVENLLLHNHKYFDTNYQQSLYVHLILQNLQ